MNSLTLRLMFALTCAIGLQARSMAQPYPGMQERIVESSDSHVLIDESSAGDLSARLSERLGNRQSDSKLIRDLLKQIGDHKSPEEILKSMPELRDPAVLERLKSFAQGQAGGGKIPPLPTEDLARLSKQLQSQGVPEKNAAKSESGANSDKANNETKPPKDPAKPATAEELPKDGRTQNWLEWFEKNVGPIENFPAIGEFMKDLAQSDPKSWMPQDSSWASSLNEWKGEMDSFKKWIDRSAKSGQFSMPEFTMPSVPNLGWSNPGNGMAGGIGGVTPSASELSWAPVIILAILAIGGMIVWGVVIRGQQVPVPELVIDPELGPWPVDPSRVESAAEFMIAFDYLALSRCGMVAQSWNHLEIRESLGARYPEHLRDANQLTDAYAYLRYAPSPGNLSSAELAQACAALREIAKAGMR